MKATSIENIHFRLEAVSIKDDETGDYKNSILQLDKYLKTQIEALGPGDHITIAETLLCMGDAFRKDGNHLKAIEEYQACLDIADKVDGGTQLLVGGQAYGGLFVSWKELNDMTKASCAIRKAISIHEQNLGSSDPMVIKMKRLLPENEAMVKLATIARRTRWPTTPRNSQQPKVAGRPEFTGLSVYFLQTIFLREVEMAGFSRDATIYELENLLGPPGLVRRKGQDVFCPITHKKGAAYVHCVEGCDCVGDATHMFSYTWG